VLGNTPLKLGQRGLGLALEADGNEDVQANSQSRGADQRNVTLYDALLLDTLARQARTARIGWQPELCTPCVNSGVSGTRSGMAKLMLKRKSYQNVYNI